MMMGTRLIDIHCWFFCCTNAFQVNTYDYSDNHSSTICIEFAIYKQEKIIDFFYFLSRGGQLKISVCDWQFACNSTIHAYKQLKLITVLVCCSCQQCTHNFYYFSFGWLPGLAVWLFASWRLLYIRLNTVESLQRSSRKRQRRRRRQTTLFAMKLRVGGWRLDQF